MQMYLKEKYNEGREEGRIEILSANIRSIADILSPTEIAKRFNVSLDFVQQVLNGEKAE